MSVANKLVTYDVKVPNYRLLLLVRAVGLILAVAGIALAILGAWGFMSGATYGSAEYEYRENLQEYEDCIALDTLLSGYWIVEPDCTQPVRPWLDYFEWYYSLIGLFGAVLFVWASHRHSGYYETVHQGKIIHKDIRGGGWSGISWMICVEGYNLANQKIQQWESIPYSTFEQYEVGDYIDFRN